MAEPTIIAIDLETTCLEPADGQILEAQCYQLDADLNIISEFYGIFPLLLRTTVPETVRQMHMKSGLWYEPANASTQDLLNYLMQFNNIIFLGNSVSFDKEWLCYYFPPLIEKMHYRIIDTSSILSLCPELRIKMPHRATADIQRSIKIAKLAQYAIRQQGISDEEY